MRWKLLVFVCSVAALGSYGASSALSASQSTAPAAHRTFAPRANRAIRFFAVRQLAHGRLPGRQTFVILGERYRFDGRVWFSLAVSINRPGTPPGGGGGAGFNPSESRGVLAVTFMASCIHHRPYAVVFGLLRAGSDEVIARRGRGTTALQHVALPAVLHARGVLVYGALAGPPNELIVRRLDGKRLLDEKFPSNQGCLPGTVSVIPIG